MKTRTAPWDYERPIAPLKQSEWEAEYGAPCPKCGEIGMAVDLLPGAGVSCLKCGVNLLDPRSELERDIDWLAEDEAETQDKFLAEMYDEIAEARLCARFETQL